MNTSLNLQSVLKVLFCATIFCFGIGQVSAAPLNAYWAQGTAASIQSPTNGVGLNKFGWGAVYTVPSRISGTGTWGHIALPTPVIVNNIRSTLTQVLVQFNGNAKISQVDVWDGPNRIASQAVNWTGDHRLFGNWGVITIPNTPAILFGVSVSFYVSNNCAARAICPKQTMNVVSVGGDFLD